MPAVMPLSPGKLSTVGKKAAIPPPVLLLLSSSAPSLALCEMTYLPRKRLVEKAVATHSITLAWRIPWMEEPGGLQSMGSHRVGLD